MARWHFEQVVDLARPEGPRTWPDLMMVEGDQDAHQWRVEVLDGGQAASLAGYSVTAYFDRCDGVTIPVVGTIREHSAIVSLPQSAYLAPGPMICTMRARSSGQTITLAAGRCIVRKGPGDAYGDPDAVLPNADDIMARLEALERNGGGGGSPTVYCWGDSLTQGIGGNVNGWHLISYPQELSQRCKCVNLGVLSEDVPTIQSRIGADKVILPDCTIPGDHTQGVEIGSVDVGLTTQSGRKSHIIKYGEAGVNPCFVGDTKCILYRDYKSDTVSGTKYYIRRFEDGDAVVVEDGTPLETFGARYYQGGFHIFWMGANGGYGNLTDSGTDLAFSDYIARLQACVDAVNPDDYLIVYARERIGYTSDESGEKEVLASTFSGHFVDLLPALRDRGLMYSETSIWDGTLKNGVPSVLDSGDGCHYSFYGYKAIAGVLWEYVCPKLLAIKGSTGGGTGGGTGGSGSAPTGDDFGTWAYKLKTPKTLTATSTGIETGFAPFAEEDKEWTIAVRVAANATRSGNNLIVYWMQEWFIEDAGNKGLALCCYADSSHDQPSVYMLDGFGGFMVDPDSMGLTPSTNGYHTYIVSRQGSNYWNYVDGQLIYGGPLGYDTTGYTSSKTVKIGYDGGNGRLIGDVNDIRIYNTFLDKDKCVELFNELQ